MTTRVSSFETSSQRSGHASSLLSHSNAQEGLHIAQIAISSFKKDQKELESRHICDNALFILWDSTTSNFRLFRDADLTWIRNRFDIVRIAFEFLDIIVITNLSQSQSIFFIVVDCLATFISSDVTLSTVLWLDEFRSYSIVNLDLLSIKLLKFWFSTLKQQSSIVNILQDLVTIRVVHYLSSLIIVKLSINDDRIYQ